MKFVFSVFDSVALHHSAPFIVVRREVAVRDFTAAINNPQSPLASSPGDYSLVELGTLDEQSGEIVPGRVVVLNGLSAITR